MKRYFARIPPLITLIALSLVLGLVLTACGTEATPASSAATAVSGAVQTAGTVAANGSNTASTVAGGAVATAGPALTQASTVVSGAAATAGAALTQAPTIVSGAVATAGAAVSSGVKTAGTAIAGALTPGATPTAAAALTPSKTPGTNSTPNAQSLPVYPGTLQVTLIPQEYSNFIVGMPVINNILSWSNFTFYKVGGVAQQAKISDFYKTALTADGWADRTGQLGAITNNANLEFLGTVPAIYTRGDNILLVAVSSPLTQDFINNSRLDTTKFQAGDILIMTLLGNSRISIS